MHTHTTRIVAYHLNIPTPRPPHRDLHARRSTITLAHGSTAKQRTHLDVVVMLQRVGKSHDRLRWRRGVGAAIQRTCVKSLAPLVGCTCSPSWPRIERDQVHQADNSWTTEIQLCARAHTRFKRTASCLYRSKLPRPLTRQKLPELLGV